MIRGIKAVFDTNVYISGIVYGGVPRDLLILAEEQRFKLFISVEILLEIVEKLRENFLWNEDKIELVIATVSKTATLVKTKRRLAVVKDDKSDNKIIECAYSSKAKLVVSGDKHLLRLRKVMGIEVVKPRDFYKTIVSL